MKLLKQPILIINFLLVLATALAYLSPYISPSFFSPIAILGIFFPWLFLANIVFILFWFVFKIKHSLWSLVVLLIGYSHLASFVGFHAPLNDDLPKISILSHNLQGLRYAYIKKGDERKTRLEEYQGMLKKASPDIFCVQEVGPRGQTFLLNKDFFEFQTKKVKFGPAIFSKHQIINEGELAEENRSNKAVWADIVISKDTLRVYSFHLQSNRISDDDVKILDQETQGKDTWESIVSVVSKYKKRSVSRENQAHQINKHILSSPYPVLLAGDMNDTPLSYVYRIFSKGLCDSFRLRGGGLGTSFAGNIPALRIDYIFTDKAFKILEHEVIKPGYSDHYPIKSIVTLQNAEKK